MRLFAVVALILSLFACVPAQAGPVRGAVKLAAKSAKVAKVVKVVRPLKLVGKVLPPFRGK